MNNLFRIISPSALVIFPSCIVVAGKLGAATVSHRELEQPGVNAMFDKKIKSEAELLELVAKLRPAKCQVMTNGCFDILQPGHVANLE